MQVEARLPEHIVMRALRHLEQGYRTRHHRRLPASNIAARARKVHRSVGCALEPREREGQDPDPLHATIEEFAADGYTHVEAELPALPCNPSLATQPASQNLVGAYAGTGLARRLRCADAESLVLSIKPWRQTDASGRPSASQAIRKCRL